MKQKQYMQTTRLILRDWKEEDIPHLARMNSDDRVMEYFLKPLSYDETIAMYNKRSEHVMQKIGMTRIKEFNHPLVEPNHALYRHILYKIDLATLEK